ncbi:MAG TPA: AsmA family protein [Candidatus Binatia bacterium]
MLRTLKRSGFALVLLLIAIIIALGTFVLFANRVAERQRAQVEQELRTFLGKDITFDSLNVRLWGGPGFAARQFRIADDPRFAATPFVRARELKLGLDLWRLLRGEVLITSLRFEDAEFQIITNEAGVLNTSVLASRKKRFTALPNLRIGGPERPTPARIFEIRNVRIVNGRLDFIDRSVTQPAELQIKNIELEARGLTSSAPTAIKFTAALTEGVTYDVKIDGTIGPLREEREWSQQPVNLAMQFDALFLPAVTRALPTIRTKVPPELNVTGPMSLDMNLAGTLQRPRLTDVTLKVPLFGAADYNATLTGMALFPEAGEWSDAELKGTLSLDRVNLSEMRLLPSLKEMLPADLVTDGSLSAACRFEGTWKTLRLGASADVNAADLVLDEWLRKPAGYPARIRAQLSRRGNDLLLLPSSVTMGSSAVEIRGMLDQSHEIAAIQLKVSSRPAPIASVATLVSPLAAYTAQGTIDWDLMLEKNGSVQGGGWKARGTLNLADVEIASRESNKKIAHLYGKVLFEGSQARIENASFQLGSSRMNGTAHLPDLGKTRGDYKLFSPELDLADIPSLPAGVKLANVSSEGKIQLENGSALLKGTISSASGGLRTVSYRDLKGDMTWSTGALQLTGLSLQAFGGTVVSDLTWVTDNAGNHLEVTPELRAVDVKQLLAEIAPRINNPMRGLLDFRGTFTVSSKPGASLQEALKGSGEGTIRKGTLAGFNLIRQFVLRGHRPSGSSRLPATLVAIADRPDTAFETLKADFKLDEKGLIAGNMVMTTEEYAVTGSGWVKSDRTTKWNANLLLGPVVTQDLLREYRTIRFFIDRRGRLPIGFKVEGKVPNLTIRPENRVLAQAFRWGSTFSLKDKSQDAKKESKKWMPDSLDRLLGR